MRIETDLAESPRRPRRIIVVGAGLAGTATAIRLLRFATEPVEIVLLERQKEHRHAGVAYHAAGNPWNHIFNIQAGRMSAFREDVDDFLNWANGEADRSAWPPQWREVTFFESDPAPRRIYADYLGQRLAEAATEAGDGVVLLEADGEMVDLTPSADGIRAVIENLSWSGGPGLESTTVDADHIILATGPELRHPRYAQAVLDHPSYIRRAYTGEAVERIRTLPPRAVVAIIGTLLSAYDFAALLLRQGHTGAIYMISPSNSTPGTYPADHQHGVLAVPPPIIDVEQGRAALARQLEAEWVRACRFVAEQHPEVHAAVISERVAKAWEAYLPDIFQNISAADLQFLLDKYGSRLATLRVSAMAYTTAVVDAAHRVSGQVQVVTGRVTDLRPLEQDRLLLTLSGDGPHRTLAADLVISNFGREFDYAAVTSRLWQCLLDNGLAVPHRKTRRGVEVDRFGALLMADGRKSGAISAVGAPREGDEIVRHGRLGAFSFNLATIKNHSVSVAAEVLRKLESRYASLPDSASSPPLESAWAELVSLEVQRLAARQWRTRVEYQAQLEAKLREASGQSDIGTWLAAINRAAVDCLTDLSVTPRELRAQLMLDLRPATPDSSTLRAPDAGSNRRV
ncbi:FAD/NAD(P)-binding protein [Nocardia brasiliensis]|uniref:FAD/NAD(P)-binding protein n=1 Tax=Nocardia brasiliensis TaxID=37326 RepID=UPI00245688E2|nr:FAD/NAD(P)-binding protein [Nocardia brasiliensis]